MTDFFVFGAGGHAKVVLEALRAAHPGAEIAMLDDDAARWGDNVLGTRIVGGREHARTTHDVPVIPALGDNAARCRLIEWATAAGVPVASAIHPHAIVSPSAVLGAGSFLAAGVVINAEARLGRGVIVNTGASVDHDCDLGDAVHIAPGARLCGAVVVGARTLVGAGSVVIPGIVVGADCIVGAGAVVIRPVTSGTCVAGVPATLVKAETLLNRRAS